MKRWISFLLLIIMGLFLSGCWDRQELNEITVITGLAVDKGEKHKYKLTIETLNATELNPKTGGNSTPSITFDLEGDTIAELTQKLNVGITRIPVYSHMRTVVISQDIAEQGLLDFFDFMESNREIRNDFNLIIAQGVPAADILKITYPIQKASTMKLNMQLSTMVEMWGGDPSVRLKDMVSALVSPGREPVAAVVRIQGTPEKGRSTDNMTKVEPDALVVLNGLAVFKGMKYQGDLSIRDTRNYLWIQDNLRKTTLVVPCGEKHRFFTVRVYNSATEIETKYQQGKPHFIIRIEFESSLLATQCTDDLGKKEIFEKYEKMIKKAAEKEIKDTIHKAQHQFQADIFGFGEEMHRQDYKRFEKVKDNWNEEFARAELTVEVTAKIRRSGLRGKSFLGELK